MNEIKIQFLADAMEILASNSVVVNEEIEQLKGTIHTLLEIADTQNQILATLLENEN